MDDYSIPPTYVIPLFYTSHITEYDLQYSIILIFNLNAINKNQIAWVSKFIYLLIFIYIYIYIY